MAIPTRPIGDGRQGPHSQLSEIISIILNSAADSFEDEMECPCTEDMIAAMDVSNKMEIKNQVIVSLDVKAFYPSLQPEETSDVCETMVLNCKMNMDGLNYEEMGLYWVTTHEMEELLQLGLGSDILPCRRRKGGRGKPGITTKEVLGPFIRNPDKSLFNKPSIEPIDVEKKIMLKQSIKTAIKMIMTNHTFKKNLANR